jgi:hypothetical protein
LAICDACRSKVPEVTREFEDALCDLCLEIQRYDRLTRPAEIRPLVAELPRDRRAES